ncbi:MAG: hypothetical protein FWG71_09730 [Synergistaceae bacterium]|nr:hypothetical protein [Synergistaceae bacterium]
MSALAKIGNLVERVTGNIEAIAGDREKVLSEVSALRERLMERDKEAVKAARDMRAELEAARMSALFFEQERIRIEARRRNLDDRLASLVGGEQRRGG